MFCAVVVAQRDADGHIAGQIQALCQLPAETNFGWQVNGRVTETEPGAGGNSDDIGFVIDIADYMKKKFAAITYKPQTKKRKLF